MKVIQSGLRLDHGDRAVKKKVLTLIFLILSVINTIIAGFWISGIGRKTELLARQYGSAVTLDSSLYDNTSLNLAISKLKKDILIDKAINRRNDEYNSLKMTKEIMDLFEQNRVKVISYRLEGTAATKGGSEELYISAEGKPGSILKLIYDLSFSKEDYRINFISVDTRFPGKPAALVIRITYA